MLHTTMGAGLLVVMLATASDRPPAAGRVVGGPAAAHRIEASAYPAFALFGWVSPPVESTTAGRVVELAGAGLNLLLPAWEDSGRVANNLTRLDFAAANGALCLIWDRRFEDWAKLDPDSPAAAATLDTIVVTYRDHPGFAGYYLGDEPPRTQFPQLARLFTELRARDPDHPAYNDLLGVTGFATLAGWEDYVHAYFDSTRARALSYNEYDFQISGDRGFYVEQLAAAAAVAREYGIPFWTIVQVIQHYQYRALTDGELLWQVSMALAYGARGIGYFTYWTPAPDSVSNWHYGMIAWDGSRTHWYDLISALNPRLGATGRRLARLTWLATEHAGSVPLGATPFSPSAWIAAVEGRAALGAFADSIGTRYVLVVNADSLVARTVALTLPGARGVDRLGDDGVTWTALDTTHAAAGPRVALDLGPGDFALLRLAGPGEPLRAGAGPGLRIEPNPAGARARLEFAGVRARGHVEILDAGGRRIWSRRIAEGSTSLLWDGARDDGGTAPAGLYFARAEDAGGVTVVRLSWLGRR